MNSTTFSNPSRLGISNLCHLASYSRVGSMVLLFNRTYQSLCVSSLLLFLTADSFMKLQFSSPTSHTNSLGHKKFFQYFLWQSYIKSSALMKRCDSWCILRQQTKRKPASFDTGAWGVIDDLEIFGAAENLLESTAKMHQLTSCLCGFAYFRHFMLSGII